MLLQSIPDRIREHAGKHVAGMPKPVSDWMHASWQAAGAWHADVDRMVKVLELAHERLSTTLNAFNSKTHTGLDNSAIESMICLDGTTCAVPERVATKVAVAWGRGKCEVDTPPGTTRVHGRQCLRC